MTEKIVPQLDPHGYVIGAVVADQSPLEPGVYLIPGGAVDADLPIVPPGKRARWNGAGFNIEDIPQPPTEPTPTLDELKERAWDRIKAKRDATKTGGVKVGTKWYHSDESSRTQYIGLLRMADALVTTGGTSATTLQYGGQDVQWKTMDGTFVKMTVQRANDVFNAVSGLDFAAFGAAEAHKAAMEASADPASYDFAAGWPATFGG